MSAPISSPTGAASSAISRRSKGAAGADWDTAPYIASKHGLVGLTKAAALRHAKAGIRVNAICPGGVRTPIWGEGFNDEQEATLGTMHPVGRMGEPEEIAEAIVWLCSNAASFVTGHSMVVDGGAMAGFFHRDEG